MYKLNIFDKNFGDLSTLHSGRGFRPLPRSLGMQEVVKTRKKISNFAFYCVGKFHLNFWCRLFSEQIKVGVIIY